MEPYVFELTAAVPVAEEAPTDEDAFVVQAQTVAEPAGDWLEVVVDQWVLPAEFLVDNQASAGDYLYRPQSEWSEADWSLQLFGEPGHSWAEMGFV